MIPIDWILEAGAKVTHASVRQLRSSSRHRWLTIRRKWIAGKMRAEGYSYPQIGRAFGGRDHATVMYWLR
jgi:chromosomal replication initiation ATPase DnaA